MTSALRLRPVLFFFFLVELFWSLIFLALGLVLILVLILAFLAFLTFLDVRAYGEKAKHRILMSSAKRVRFYAGLEGNAGRVC